jgi:hypothetical protein
MRILILAAAVGAAALPATAASAQYWGGYSGYNNRAVQEQRDCNRALRRADTRAEYYRIMRQCQRETTRSYDYGRNRDNGYYGDRYSNDGRYWDGYRWRYR